MEPSHNDPLNHTPAHLSSNFGAPGQPSPAPSALLVNLDSNIGAPGQPSPTTSVLLVKPRRQLRRSQSTFASNFGAPGQSNFACLRQQLRRSRSTSPATWALPVKIASNLGALGQPSPATSALPVNPRQQTRRSRSTSPATSVLPINLRQQLRRSRSTFASNFGAPGQPSPATSALAVEPCGFSVPLRPHSARSKQGQHREGSLPLMVAIFLARILPSPASDTNKHPLIVLPQVMCFIL